MEKASKIDNKTITNENRRPSCHSSFTLSEKELGLVAFINRINPFDKV